MAKAGSHVRQRWPLAVLGVFTVTGFLFAAASLNSGGDDLRPAGGDIASLLHERAERIDARRVDARTLRAEIDQLSAGIQGEKLDELRTKVRKLEPATGLTAVEGPGIRVTLTDAPRSGNDPDVNPNWLVVHQQDIQSYVNALWAGGAEAISLQGQRLMSTSGITCVGNTVVLDGVPYSPPYVIEAVGDTTTMNRSLIQSPATSTYAYYAQEYKLGLEIKLLASVRIKAYANPVELSYARISS